MTIKEGLPIQEDIFHEVMSLMEELKELEKSNPEKANWLKKHLLGQIQIIRQEIKGMGCFPTSSQKGNEIVMFASNIKESERRLLANLLTGKTIIVDANEKAN